jgi:signal transduction histidine kinase
LAHRRHAFLPVATSRDTGVRCLAADPSDLETARRAFQRIVRDGHRAADTLDHIRTLTKKTAPEKRHVDLNEISSETIGLIHAEAQGNGTSLRTDLASSNLSRVYGDRIQLQQVIVDLAINAIEAMVGEAVQKREVTIVSRQEADRVVVAIYESGPGLRQESLDHLFDAFYTTKARGMGMGLAISRSIIESHEGKLCAMRNEPCGAIFQFDWPIHGDDMPSRPKAL